jgi:ankyrin repeat protein
VFDALDECDPADLKILVDIMNDAFLKAPPEFKVKCLMTSRPYEQVSGEFAYLVERFPQIRIPGEQESETIRMEVERVVQVRVKNLAKKRKLSPKLQEHLESRLLEASHRTYLWVYLVFEYLEEEAFKRTARGLDDVLRTLPNSVNDAYEKILSRSKEDDFVRKALAFIITAVRPLEVSELNVALHVEAEHTSNFDLDLEEDEEFEQRLRDCCGLFLTINHGKVYLLHQTAREFLVKRLPTSDASDRDHIGSGGSENFRHRTWQNSIVLEDANLLVAEACVAFLRNLDPDIFGLEPVGTNDDIERLAKIHSENVQFLHYSVNHWEYHMRLAQESSQFPTLIAMLQFQHGCSNIYWRLTRFSRTSSRSQFHAQAYASAEYQLHLAAALDHIKIVEYLAGSGASVNAGSHDDLDPPLRHAALSGSYHIVKFLLEQGADVNGTATGSVLKRTALFPTSIWASEEVVKLLLQSGANPNHRDQNGQTPLFFAKSGRMAQQFLEAGAQVDAADVEGFTPLFKAIAVESEAILKTLLQWGANSRTRTSVGSTPLFEALKATWWMGFELLLENGGSVNALGPDGERTIWSLMAEEALSGPSGEQEMPVPSHLLHLVQRDLERHTNAKPQTTPLHIAAHYGLSGTLERLLKEGARVDARDKSQATPLIAAASGRSYDIAILKLLLSAGADPNAASDTRTPLLAAVHREWEEGVRVLLVAGADPNIDTAWAGSPALHIAASLGLEAMLKDLIEKGADINRTDKEGRSALQLATEFGEETIVEILRERGASEDINA